MKLLLIAPSSGHWRLIGQKDRRSGRVFRFSLLSLLSLAALTPESWEVEIRDEQIEVIPDRIEADLVGITCMTALAPRAYELADQFRARGIRVVLGGMHPTFMPEEALGHADAVVVGEAEGVWERVLADCSAGRLRGIYKSAGPPSLAGLRPVPRRLLQRGAYGTIQAVQATRGCPRSCSFCSISSFSRATQRHRPVAEVAAEVASLREKFLIFVDDNLTANRDYALELFAALRPLRKDWITQTTLRMADDPKLVAAAAASGCVGVFVGLETVDQTALRGVAKGFNRVANYSKQVATLHAAGIGVEAGVVFGLDGHTPTVFRDTIRALDELAIDAVQISIATPLPGTPLYEAWRPRLTDTDWAHYDLHNVVFEPNGMAAEQLKAGHDWATAEFYRPHRIARRLARWTGQPRGLGTLRYAAAINLGYNQRVRAWGLVGRDPATDRLSAAMVV